MCVYIYIHICIYIYVYMYMYMHVYVYMYTCCYTGWPGRRTDLDRGELAAAAAGSRRE